ncbi:MAG: ATP-binding protein [Eubacteriales bacterium]|nr:ATP-binding protein [Eubacteriales bacterium]
MNKKNPIKKLSLQWRLTLIITLLTTVTCVLMYFFISRSAVTGIEDLGDYVVRINKTDSTPITFNINPNTLFSDLSDQVQATKDLFRTRSVIATAIIILLSSICTYFISRRALQPLRSLSRKINETEAQNLSESLEVPDTNDEISHLTVSFNKMLSRLDDAFTAQKQFSASAAHELRTPLAVMQTNLEVFARKKTPTLEEYQELFEMIQSQTGRLSHLSEVLLDMTGIQSVERSDSISLAVLTDEVCCDLASIADQKEIELIQEDGDCTVTGSYLLLYRAVYNLVENAIKYNHPGGKVTVKISQKKAEPDCSAPSVSTDYACIEVTDTGIGISPEYQEKIFAPFFRVDKSRSRAMGGAGLGLALVNEIARQHGGLVKVLESSKKGSTITLILPLSLSLTD